MSKSAPEPPTRSTLANAEDALDGMMARLQAILAEDRLTPDRLVEITAIFNNASYVFLYFEANNEHIDFADLLQRRDAFYKNPSLDRRILSKLHACGFDDPGVERSRRAYIDQLTEKSENSDASTVEEIDALKAQIADLEEAVARDQMARIEQLGLPTGDERPSAFFYRLSSRTSRPETREKLARLWSATGEEHRFEMATVVDRMIEIRRRRAASTGAAGLPIAATLRKCRVDEAAVTAFLDRYLDMALVEHQALEREIAAELDVDTAPMAHFSYYQRQHFGGERAPLFNLDACLHYIFAVAKAVFGLDFAIIRHPLSPVILTEVSRDGAIVGKINFDLWASHGKDLGANHTWGLRNRAQWGSIIQLPEAWVSCRFEAKIEEKRLITFQNVHSLFHEFGHAINHLLVQESIPNQSGLEYLPLERLEYLSMWFEKWVYHREFGNFLDLPEHEIDGLRRCAEAKKTEYRRTYVERAVTASLDFECHRREDATLRKCFDVLDARHRIGRFVRFTDFPAYFSWPMFMANPGANFAYLWGAAWSCTNFCTLEGLSLSEIAADRSDRAWCDPCFRFELPSAAPAPESAFSFYRPARRAPAFASKIESTA